jgi:hypothetical protein
MSAVDHRTIADDPKVAAAIRQTVDKAPAPTAAAVDLLRRLDCPTRRR